MLRVGIVLDSVQSSEWKARLIEELESRGLARIEVAFINDSVSASQSRLFSYYERWDRLRRSGGQDALEAHDLTGLLRTHTIVYLRNIVPPLTPELDVLLDLCDRPLSHTLGASPRLGTWYLQFGRPEQYGVGSPHLFWELYRRDPVSEISLLAVDGMETRILACSVSATHKLSLHLSRNPLYWKAVEMVLHALKQAEHLGRDYLDRSELHTRVISSTCKPGLQHVLSLAFHQAFAIAGRRVAAFDPRNRAKWYLAIRPRSLNRSFCDASEYALLQSPPDRFYADPCLFDHNGKTYLLFEDFRYADDRALISGCEVYRDGTLGETFEVLKRPYHLSYPLVFEDNGEIYLVPESRGSRSIELYRAVKFPTDWVAEPPLLSGVQAVDATIHKIDNLYWMFTSITNGLYSSCDDLSLFFSPSLKGPWAPHLRNPLIRDVRKARSAGSLFYDEGRLIRPSQDCSEAYGYAIVFSEITKLSETEYEDREICRVKPLLEKHHEATHTYTRNDQFEIVDRLIAPKHAS